MCHKVDEYIDNLPEYQRVLAEQARHMIHSLVPGIEEKFSFKIPFYHYFGMFCYINAVPGGIDIAFCRGRDLVESFPQLELKGRAIVASVTLFNRRDFEKIELREIITAAAMWNEEAKKNKIPMISKRRLN